MSKITRANPDSDFWRAAKEASRRVSAYPPWKLGDIRPRGQVPLEPKDVDVGKQAAKLPECVTTTTYHVGDRFFRHELDAHKVRLTEFILTHTAVVDLESATSVVNAVMDASEDIAELLDRVSVLKSS
jgi:hypothetical protein